MATLDNTPEPPRELIAEGERWARERFLVEKSEEIFEGLKEHFRAGMDIFFAHRARLAESIEAEGGVERFEHHSILGDGANLIRCRSGKLMYAHEVLNTDLLRLPVPDSATVPEGTKQFFVVSTSFGGTELGIPAADVTNVYRVNHELLGRDALERFFADDFTPGGFAVTESVVTSYAGEVSTLPLSYAINTRTWYAKLREEFAPNPYQDPEGYRRWAEDPPIEMTDMEFAATAVEDGESGSPALRTRRYMNHYGSVEGGEQAALKFLRFEELLGLVYEQCVPEAARPERRMTPIRDLGRAEPPMLPTAG